MKERLDSYLSAREQIDIEQINTLIMTGKVIVDGTIETKPGRQISDRNQIQLIGLPRRYPARSAEKLIGAISDFSKYNIHDKISGRVCVDLGASNGGFTQVLLEHGAKKVYCIDVGYGLLDHKLQQDQRVVVLDRHNIKDIDITWFDKADFQYQPWFISSDISFLSIVTVFESLASFAHRSGTSFYGIFLLKPQFEASAQTYKGIIKDESLRQSIKQDVIEKAIKLGFEIIATADSKLTGRKGNIEICLLCRFGI